jgi:hypothetical protein
VHGAALDIKDIDHILNSEHEFALLILSRAMAPMVICPYFIRPIELTVYNGAFYARTEWYMASQAGIGRTYTCLCQRIDGHAVCVDVKLLGTTEGLSQKVLFKYSCMSMAGFWVHASWEYDVMAQTL